MAKPVLVTGGCGFVGRHLIRYLLERGDSVWVVDNLFTGLHPDKWLSGFEKNSGNGTVVYKKSGQELVFIEKDALDFFLDQIKSRSALVLPEFSDVFHLASIVGGRLLIDGDPMLVSTDLAIDSLFFVWATRNKNRISRIMYTSSSASYPVNLQSKEKHIALPESAVSFGGNLGQPDMTYGWSKLSGEYLATLAAKNYGMHVACVRPFSGYGEDQDLTYPVPAIADRVARRENPIEVWGTGEQGRDFVYIDDCIEAMFTVLDKVSDGRGINIGNGELRSFNEIIGVLSKLEGYDPVIKRLLDKPVGVQSRYADPKIIYGLGWKPKVGLEEGMGRVLEAAKKRNQNLNLSQ